MKKLILSVFTFLSLVCAPTISAAENVKIGVLYPLTGPVAQVGKDAVAAVQTALDIINNSHNIPGMPLAKDAGLKGLGGGKISIVVGDLGGKPDIGVGETEKMLNSDKVHAMFGAYSLPGIDMPSQSAEATLSIRPEDLLIADKDSASVKGKVSFVRDLGSTIETFIDVNGVTLTTVTTPRERVFVAVGDEVGLTLTPEHCVVLTR